MKTLLFQPGINVEFGSKHKALHAATTQGCESIVSHLLNAGANVNAVSLLLNGYPENYPDYLLAL